MTEKIGIISLGLIGGSILKSLSAAWYEICAVTRNKQAVQAAKAYTPYVSDDMSTLQGCNVIFVCSPMSKTLEILDFLENIADKDTIVADVCSLKSFVMQKNGLMFLSAPILWQALSTAVLMRLLRICLKVQNGL